MVFIDEPASDALSMKRQTVNEQLIVPESLSFQNTGRQFSRFQKIGLVESFLF